MAGEMPALHEPSKAHNFGDAADGGLSRRWAINRLAHHAGAAALHEFFDFLARGHGGVAGRCGGQGTMGGAVIDGRLWIVLRKESEGETAGKAVATAHTVEDVEFGIFAALVEGSIVPANGAPVVSRSGDDPAEGRGSDFEVRIFLHGCLDHALEGLGLNRAEVVIHSLHLEAEGCGEVLFVADHDIDILGDLAIHFAGLGLAADGFPERGSVIEVVTHNRAVLFGGGDRFDGDLRGGFGQSSKDATGVEPAGAELAEDVVPIVVAGFELRGGAVATVGIANGSTDAKAALGEVQAIPNRAADPIVLTPFDELGVHPTLHDEVLDEVADFIVHKSRANGCAEAEAFAQTTRCVVFAAAFPSGELTRCANATFAGVEAQHDFAEGDLIVEAGGWIAECE